jgi:hypothetical protein
MWRHVDLVWTDVSEEHIASVFRLEKSTSEEPARVGGKIVVVYILIFINVIFTLPYIVMLTEIWGCGSDYE